MVSDKQSINHLVKICELRGIKDIIFSPGSRNASLIIAFNKSDIIQCHIVPDERVAAFMALGMSLQSGVATIICCTSGTAALNYAPAIAEAYYQGIPMIVITADRPIEWIDQGIGQSMRQNGLYSNYIKGSFKYLQEAKDDDAIWYNDRILNEAINMAYEKLPGPVHINIPFTEPLYNQGENNEELDVKIFKQISANVEISSNELEDLMKIWQRSNRKVIILGQLQKNETLENLLKTLVTRNDIILLSETCSNIQIDNHIQCIDRVITTFEGEEEIIRPDLLISIGGPVISKKVKHLFQKFHPEYHWYVNPSKSQDCFKALTTHIKTDGELLLYHLVENQSKNNDDFQNIWNDRNERIKVKHQDFISKSVYSDLKVFDTILAQLPENICLHSSNSTPVRYLQLFDRKENIIYQANRGVGGIDGCSSTALGYALNSTMQNILITGDIAFFYDSNAFWQNNHPNNFKVILINNGGGGIFRIIDGPASTDELEEYFEARHSTSAKHLALMHDLDYSQINDISQLEEGISLFVKSNSNKISVLEIFTPADVNDVVLKDYFNKLKADH